MVSVSAANVYPHGLALRFWCHKIGQVSQVSKVLEISGSVSGFFFFRCHDFKTTKIGCKKWLHQQKWSFKRPNYTQVTSSIQMNQTLTLEAPPPLPCPFVTQPLKLARPPGEKPPGLEAQNSAKSLTRLRDGNMHPKNIRRSMGPAIVGIQVLSWTPCKRSISVEFNGFMGCQTKFSSASQTILREEILNDYSAWKHPPSQLFLIHSETAQTDGNIQKISQTVQPRVLFEIPANNKQISNHPQHWCANIAKHLRHLRLGHCCLPQLHPTWDVNISWLSQVPY